jgi:hypothetical protein
VVQVLTMIVESSWRARRNEEEGEEEQEVEEGRGGERESKAK